MENPRTLIYILDEETLGQLHKDWPGQMLAALCLDERGSAEVVLLQESEFEGIALRLASLLGRDDSDFLIVPKLGGYPTRKLSFGEAQQMYDLVAGIDELADAAKRYLADHRTSENGATEAEEINAHAKVGRTPQPDFLLSFPKMAAIARRKHTEAEKRFENEPKGPRVAGASENCGSKQQTRRRIFPRSTTMDGDAAKDQAGAEKLDGIPKPVRVIRSEGGYPRVRPTAESRPQQMLSAPAERDRSTCTATTAIDSGQERRKGRQTFLPLEQTRERPRHFGLLARATALAVTFLFVQIGFSANAAEEMGPDRTGSLQHGIKSPVE